jgi:hypothetical protein
MALKLNSKGIEVVKLQKNLTKLGFYTKDDGDVGYYKINKIFENKIYTNDSILNVLKNHKNKYYVYFLLDDNLNIFYVGKGKYNRCTNHYRTVIKNNRKISNKHLENKLKLIINLKYFLIENLNHEISCEIEKYYINLFGRSDLKNGKLCNLTDGGEGSYKRILSEKTKKQMSDKMSVKEYVLLNKNNEIIKFNNLRKFCRENNIDRSRIMTVFNRKDYSAYGYKLPNSTKKEIGREVVLIDIKSNVKFKIKNIGKFCKNNHISVGNFYNMLSGKLVTCSGYTIPNQRIPKVKNKKYL